MCFYYFSFFVVIFDLFLFTASIFSSFSVIETTIVLWARHRCGSSREEITKCVALRLHLTLHDLEFCRQTNEFRMELPCASLPS